MSNYDQCSESICKALYDEINRKRSFSQCCPSQCEMPNIEKPTLEREPILQQDGFPVERAEDVFTSIETPSLENLISKGNEESDAWFQEPPEKEEEIPIPKIPPASKVQYTPSTSRSVPTATDMTTSQTKVSQSVNKSQDPDGIDWLKDDWTKSKWDGIPLNTSGKTKEQLCDWLFPSSGYALKGLRERFYELNPFEDNSNPQQAEIDEWNLEVIRHYRKLLGNTTPVENDARLFMEARWADERKRTIVWDVKYPDGVKGARLGPCWSGTSQVDTAGGHCGEAFWPDEEDRIDAIASSPYKDDFSAYPELKDYKLRRAQASGISSTNADLPWSIKLASIIGRWICKEGLTGHSGPYVGSERERTSFGSSWWYTGGKSVSFRGKWR